ncbi:MAG: SRPBCC domain-containing protein [Propionibacteriaceae bacterium]|nr:SRPBCC domain-containing protein [Propionibacteriaceae bacterium]
MPVTAVHHDLDTLTLTITAEFAAPVERIWQIYADPRQLEKIWGPPTHPATFVDHELAPGGRMTYYMTGPEGEKYPGYWEVVSVDEPHGFTFRDGFADQDLKPDPNLPVGTTQCRFTAVDTDAGPGCRAEFVSRYEDAAALQQVLDMGAAEGSRLAINQIDDLVAV